MAAIRRDSHIYDQTSKFDWLDVSAMEGKSTSNVLGNTGASYIADGWRGKPDCSSPDWLCASLGPQFGHQFPRRLNRLRRQRPGDHLEAVFLFFGED